MSATTKPSRGRWAGVVLALLLASPVAQAQVNALPSLPHLLVKGEASRDVVPDRFTVSVTLTAIDMQPDAARERVQANLAALLSLLASPRGGAIPESVDATVFSVAPEYAQEDRVRVFKGTKVTRQLRATFRSADDTRRFLARVQASEDVLITGIAPAYSAEAAVRSELKGEAMRQTRETARLLADSYGTRIRSLYSVSDVAPNFTYGIEAGEVYDSPSPMDAISVSGTRITPESIAVGTIAIAENLYAVFLLAE